MADKRAFAVFDVGYLDNPKMSEVLDVSTEAVLMHTYSILYSSQHLTDGHVPLKRMVKHVGAKQSDVDLLTEAHLWHITDHECPDCPQPEEGRIYVHNYLEHNRSKSDAQKLSDAGRKANEARWGNRNRSGSESDSDPEVNPQTDRQTDISSSAKTARKTSQPAAWKPNDTHRSKAKEQGLDLNEQSEAFTDWHAARGSKFVDWDRAFNSWLKKAVEFKKERQASQPANTTPSGLWDEDNNDRYKHPDER